MPGFWFCPQFIRHVGCFCLPDSFGSRDSWLLPPPEDGGSRDREALSPRLKCLRKITAVLTSWKKAAVARAQRWRRKGWRHWQVCSWACLLTRYLSSGQDMALSFRESQHKTICFEEWWETLSPIYTLLFQDVFSIPKNPPFTLYFLHNY